MAFEFPIRALFSHPALVLSASVLIAWSSTSLAQDKRALLIGIDNYHQTFGAASKPSLPSSRHSSNVDRFSEWANWQDLEGAVNDVQAMRQLLLSRKFGFDEKNVYVLPQSQATREHILTAMTKYLLQDPNPGDTVVFYYAGHGSQRVNSRTDKPDKLDETVVPADARNGAFDVRDKEIARLFTKVLDKGILLTAIFDSCHSGAIARGIPVGTAGKKRFLPYDPRDAVDAPDQFPKGKPEERNDSALIFSAAQHDQYASEWRLHGEPHGAFTVALMNALNALPASSAAEDIYKRVKVLMEGMGLEQQQPELAGSKERRQQALFGTGQGSGRLTVAVRPQRVRPEGSIELDGGLALGLGAGSVLKRVSGKVTDPEVTIQIREVRDLSTSIAEIVHGSAANVQPGDLFELEQWVAPEHARLQVWIPPPLAEVKIKRAVAEMSDSKNSDKLIWVDDPVRVSPDYLISWNGSTWTLTKTGGASENLGENPSANEVLAKLPAQSATLKVFLSIPPSSEMAKETHLGPGTDNSAVETVTGPERALYLLIGRLADNGVEYSWVRKNTTEERNGERWSSDSQGKQLCSPDSSFPPRTEWVPLRGSSGGVAELSRKLEEYALRLARVRSWLDLPVPPSSGAGDFPYHIALKRVDQSGTAARSTVSESPVAEGEQYVLSLQAAGELNPMLKRKWVYVEAIDCSGEGQLVFPLKGSDEGNHLPILSYGQDQWPVEIELLPRQAAFTIAPPFGLDTYILLATDDRIADLSAFNFEGVLRGGTRGIGNPLEDLLRNVNASNSRGLSRPVSANWSVQYLQIRSVARSH
jgi:hypothetical protein